MASSLSSNPTFRREEKLALGPQSREVHFHISPKERVMDSDLVERIVPRNSKHKEGFDLLKGDAWLLLLWGKLTNLAQWKRGVAPRTIKQEAARVGKKTCLDY